MYCIFLLVQNPVWLDRKVGCVRHTTGQRMLKYFVPISLKGIRVTHVGLLNAWNERKYVYMYKECARNTTSTEYKTVLPNNTLFQTSLKIHYVNEICEYIQYVQKLYMMLDQSMNKELFQTINPLLVLTQWRHDQRD